MQDCDLDENIWDARVQSKIKAGNYVLHYILKHFLFMVVAKK
jgi:hypothetical protein